MKDLQIERLVKTYEKGRVRAVDEVSFDVDEGELFGLIGPDGAGKTSIFRVLATLLLPDGGHARLHGMDVVKDYRKIRRIVGYMPGRFSLYQDLSVEENLDFFAVLFGTTVKKNYDLIKDIYVQLEPFADRRAGKLSGGMKQKLALCCALIHRPKVLLLDEPTTGVDAVSRKEFWQMLKRLRKEGITILVSTPYMDEAGLCERIALIQDGRLMGVDRPEGIIDAFSHPLYAVRAQEMAPLLRHLRGHPGVRSCHTFGEYHHITLQDTGKDVQAVLEGPFTDAQWKQVEPGIEDCFMELMQQ